MIVGRSPSFSVSFRFMASRTGRPVAFTPARMERAE